MFVDDQKEIETVKPKTNQLNYLTWLILLAGSTMLFVMVYYLYFLFV